MLTEIEKLALLIGLKTMRKDLYQKFEKELIATQDEAQCRKTRKELINDLTDINNDIHSINEIIYKHELPATGETTK